MSNSFKVYVTIPLKAIQISTSADQSVRYRNFLEHHSTVYICLVPELNYYPATMHAMDNESARS
jgi:hypothetical protein